VYRLVARGGIESVRTNAVAREAGVSSALIFYYFGTRQELLRKAFDYADARTETPGLRGDDAESPAIETIERTLLGQVDNAKVVRENWVLWSEMSAAALFDPGLRDAVNIAAERWVGCVRELILTGQDEGSIPRSVDPQAAAERLTGVTDSLGTKWLTGGLSRERTRELVRGAIELELGVVLKGSKRTGTPR
jgi:AcrR family transcriptional regulator